MSFRVRLTSTVAGWVVVVTASLAAVLLVFRGRMPEPVASHWGPAGVPDASLPFAAIAAIVASSWAVVAGVAVAIGLTGERWRRRSVRGWLGAALAGGGAFVVGLAGLTVWANLDAVEWSDARHVNWQVVPVVLGAAALGWLGWRLARRGPDVASGPAGEEVRPLQLRPGEHVVWVSSATNSWLHRLGLGMLALSAGLAAGSVFGLPRVSVYVSVALAAVTVACLGVSSIRVEVNERGLAIAYGAWRWPRRRTPLQNIQAAWTDQRRPSEVGGWGYRGLPGSATLMIRGGECLVIRYRSGGHLRISVDDAEHGAALLNALIRPAS